MRGPARAAYSASHGQSQDRPPAAPSRTDTEPPQPAPEFPGCKPVSLPRKDLEDFDRRLEYWDGRTETAWICDPASPYHEQRSRLLNTLIERIAQVRGSPIKNFGSMDLREQDAPQSIMQADESVYLHPGRRIPRPGSRPGRAPGVTRQGGPAPRMVDPGWRRR